MPRSIIGDASIFFAPPGPAMPTGYWMVNGVAVPIGVCGSDSTGDGSQAKPFATPQASFDFLYEEIDLDGQYKADVYVGMAFGGSQFFYPGLQISGRIQGQAGSLAPLFVQAGSPSFPIGKYVPVSLRGDKTNQMGAFLNPNPAAGRPAVPGLSMTDGAGLRVAGIAFDTSTAKMDCIDVFENSFLDIADCTFGNAGMPGPTDYNLHFGVAWDSTVMVDGMLTIQGGSAASFMQVAQSQVYFNNNGMPGTSVGVNIVGSSSSFPGGFFCIDDSTIYAIGVPLTGSIASGPQAVILRHGTLETGHGQGPNSMPPGYMFGGSGSPVLLYDYGITR
jgi:hypothetical protein